MGRRRQSSKPSEGPSFPEKRPRPNLNPLRRGTGSRTMRTIPSPEASVVNLASSSPRQEPVPPVPRVSTSREASQHPSEKSKVNDQRNGDDALPPPSRSSSLPGTNGNIQAHENQSTAPPEKLPEVGNSRLTCRLN